MNSFGHLYRDSLILLLVFLHAGCARDARITNTPSSQVEQSEQPITAPETAPPEAQTRHTKQSKKVPQQVVSAETYYQTGYHHEKLGHYEDALEAYTQVLTHARRNKHAVLLAAALTGQGRVYLAQGQYEKTLEVHTQALTFAPSPEDRLSIAAALSNIGKVYTIWRRYAEAFELYEHALTLYRQLDNQPGIAAVFEGFGRLYEAQKQYEQAINFYEQALALTHESDDIVLLLTEIGDIYETWEQYDDAVTYYKRALKIKRKSDDQAGIEELLTRLGNVYRVSGQGKKSVKYYARELNRAYQLGESSGIAAALMNMGRGYEAQESYEDAVKHYEQALKLERESGDPTGIAAVLASIARVYVKWGRYARADQYYEQALKVDRLLGERSDIIDHLARIDKTYAAWKEIDKSPEKMFSRYWQDIKRSRKESEERVYLFEDFGLYEEALKEYNKDLTFFSKKNDQENIVDTLRLIARVYIKMGLYDKAKESQEREFTILRKSGAAPAEMLQALQFHASWYRNWGKYDLALEYFEQALQLVPQVHDPILLSTLFQNVGALYTEWGRYTKALTYYERALELVRKVNDMYQLYQALEYIGSTYMTTGNYPKAIEYYQQALELARQSSEPTPQIFMLNRLGEVYNAWSKYDNALAYHEQALELARQEDLPDDIAATLINIGNVYEVWEQYDNALTCYEQTLTLVYNPIRLGETLSKLGSLYRKWGQHEQAIAYYTQALTFMRRVGSPSEIAATFYDMGLVYKAAENYPAAIEHFLAGIKIIEEILTTVSGDTRRDYLNQQIKIYQMLISCYVLTEDFDHAVQTIELIRGRVLAEQLSGIESAEVDPLFVRDIQHSLPEDTAILIYVENPEDETFIRLMITKRRVTTLEQSKVTFAQKVMEQYQSQIGKLLEDDVLSEEAFARIIRFYRELVIQKWPIESLSQHLYTFLFRETEELMANKTKLIILPDGMLNFLPFETLIDQNGNYLVELYGITYAQSLKILKQLQQRDYRQMPRHPVLAFGGAVYEEPDEPYEGIENDAQLKYVRRQVAEAATRGASLRNVYASWLGIAWNPLPGSLEEVATIKELVKGAELVTGEEVNESNVKLWSTNNTLARYRVLHFATHGMVEPTIPELSALVLSQFTTDKDEEDDYLRIGEVAQLQLQADFVNLSACDTGLGKIFGGQGVVGLTQSFLLAGANGLSVSLWSVADESTSQFMIALYKLVEEEGMSYSDAIAEVKRRFITGEFGEDWSDPYYWSPFIYYGKS